MILRDIGFYGDLIILHVNVFNAVMKTGSCRTSDFISDYRGTDIFNDRDEDLPSVTTRSEEVSYPLLMEIEANLGVAALKT